MATPRWLKFIDLVFLAGALVLVSPPQGSLAAETLSARELQAEVERFKALGGVYSPSGFPELPPGITPFAKWRRVATNRLEGGEVYVCLKKIRIWKTLCCDEKGGVFLELSLMDRQGEQIPFAWQECGMQCVRGGYCGPENRLYLDLNGDGDADAAIPRMGSLGRVDKSFFRNTRFVFTKDIFPLWLKRRLGPGLKDLATIGAGDSVPSWRDHPLTMETQEESREGGNH